MSVVTELCYPPLRNIRQDLVYSLCEKQRNLDLDPEDLDVKVMSQFERANVVYLLTEAPLLPCQNLDSPEVPVHQFLLCCQS